MGESQIVRLGSGDFEEGMKFLNFVFGEHSPHDFEKLLPTIYRATDEHMAHNYAIREEGEIQAVVGLFPITWRVGDATLRVAGIGGVSTHPESRGQGLMQRLMKHCVGTMRDEGFHLSWLGGQRQRYLYFGYEKCGNSITANVNRSNIRHCFDGEPGLRMQPMGKGDGDLLRRAKVLHDRQAMHCERPLEDFWRHCAAWYHEGWAALDAGDEMVGYLVAPREGGYVSELVAESAEAAERMVRTWSRERGEKGIALELNPLASETNCRFAACCEQISLHSSGNWQIFAWAEVVDALMKAKQAAGPLPEGSVVVDIEAYGAIALSVADGEAGCTRSTAEAQVTVDPATCMRLLFGPLQASQVMPLSPEGALLDMWCPLPLYWARQDGV